MSHRLTRDIKSQNVLLNGFATTKLKVPTDEVKIADFGTARADEELRMRKNTDGTLKTAQKTHATTSTIVGTGFYMPSEVSVGIHSQLS